MFVGSWCFFCLLVIYDFCCDVSKTASPVRLAWNLAQLLHIWLSLVSRPKTLGLGPYILLLLRFTFLNIFFFKMQKRDFLGLFAFVLYVSRTVSANVRSAGSWNIAALHVTTDIAHLLAAIHSFAATASNSTVLHCVSKNSGPLWYFQITPTNLAQY